MLAVMFLEGRKSVINLSTRWVWSLQGNKTLTRLSSIKSNILGRSDIPRYIVKTISTERKHSHRRPRLKWSNRTFSFLNENETTRYAATKCVHTILLLQFVSSSTDLVSFWWIHPVGFVLPINLMYELLSNTDNWDVSHLDNISLLN